MRRSAFAIVPALLLLGGTARAQDVLVEGPGIKMGEASVLHPHVGIEAGVISNVFYEETDEVVAPVLRLLAGIAWKPSGEDRLGEIDGETSARTIDFNLGVDVQYSEFLTSDEQVRKQRNLDVDARAAIVFFPKGNVAFSLSDQFQRVGRPTNFESDSHLDRDVNHFKAEMIVQPQGHNIKAGPRYENTIDIFESEQSEFADRIQHVIGARVNWKFFPYTQAYLDASYGFFRPLGDSQLGGMDYKIASNPLRVITGIDSVLTEWTTVNAYVGYANGFYESGPSYNSVVGGADFGWRYFPTGRVVLSYKYDVHDSINANYFGEHQGRLALNQQIRTFVLTGFAGVRFRGYRGVPAAIGPDSERDDVIVEGGARLAWVLLDRFSAYLDYTIQSVDTDFRNAEMDDPSYLRHEAILGISAAF